ncbi:S1 RNA-binding domain-containing protein [Actinospica robiniae]|uniref:S1 RNA-binding domain-containing protein n=1 Tax=Actinospica robiniae TaxID=304901 RepID=UPI0003F77097|nr:S1 RNA-binding domain-containing protein [Actinospica robiniae]
MNPGNRRHRRSQAIAQLEVGRQVAGPVKTITDFGVFVGLGEIDGMIPSDARRTRALRR